MREEPVTRCRGRRKQEKRESGKDGHIMLDSHHCATTTASIVLRVITRKSSVTLDEVTTIPSGNPFPAAFAMVTMSGTTPCSWNPQKWSPSRPYPT